MSTYRQIARALGVSHTTVWRTLKSSGVTNETPEQVGVNVGDDGKRYLNRPLTPEERHTRIVNVLTLRGEGKSIRAIAEHQRISVGTVHGIISNYHLVPAGGDE